MNSLREPMRDDIRRRDPNDLSENILNFSSDFTHPRNGDAAAAALDLVNEAEKIFELLENRAIESEFHVKLVTERAIEKLRMAEARIESTEAEQRAAEESLYNFKCRLHEVEKEFQRAEARIAAAEGLLALAEKRVIAAEARANNAENAIRTIEQALRTQFFGQKEGRTDKYVSGAHK